MFIPQNVTGTANDAWQPTPSLRWHKRELEQLWVNVLTNETEWKTVEEIEHGRSSDKRD